MAFERERSAGYLVNWMARLFVRAIDRRLAALELTSGYMPVFFALAAGRPLPQKELARLAAVEQPTMTATLSRMERDGLIDRVTDPSDRRGVLVSLSAKARAKLKGVQKAADDTNAEGLADLSPTEREQFMKLAQRIIATLEAAGRSN
jgi:MarR family transcriptional regulator, transcriptional regulator for hemolysin